MISEETKKKLEDLLHHPTGTTAPLADTIEEIERDLGIFLDPVELGKGKVTQEVGERVISYLEKRGFNAKIYQKWPSN